MAQDGHTEGERSADDPETATSHEEIVAENPLVELLTPASKVRILMALIDARGTELTASDICENAGITWDTWDSQREMLIERYGVIERTRMAGNSPLYRAKMDDPLVQFLEDLYSAAGARRREALSIGPDGEGQ
jgi:hypothetical protein